MTTGNRFTTFLKWKAGYAASFFLGMILMAFLTTQLSPYAVARWLKVYEHAVLGSLIASDETILKTGHIPQDILDWYDANRKR